MSEDNLSRQAALELFKNHLQHHETLSGALVSMIQGALKLSFLLNGAAIVAALSVFGPKILDQTFPKKTAVGISVGFWVCGLLLSAFAAGFYTIAQLEFQRAAWDHVRKRGSKEFELSIEEDAAGVVNRRALFRELSSTLGCCL